MKRALLIIALLVAATVARSDGIYNPTVGSWGFQDGINQAAPAVVVPGCASPTAPNGVVDLSLCSNAFYAAVIF